jgi:hypothetical protein
VDVDEIAVITIALLFYLLYIKNIRGSHNFGIIVFGRNIMISPPRSLEELDVVELCMYVTFWEKIQEPFIDLHTV